MEYILGKHRLTGQPKPRHQFLLMCPPHRNASVQIYLKTLHVQVCIIHSVVPPTQVPSS